VYSDSAFKYPSISQYPYNDRGLVHTAGDCGISNCVQLHTRADESEQGRKQGFFRHYKRHSKQLVNALKHWKEGPNTFSTCEYRDGILEIKSAIDHTKIRFMKYMMRHLEEAYPRLLGFVTEIETDHIETCNKIQDIMVSDTPITLTPSFQKIIIDKIASTCPALHRSTDKTMTEKDIYLPDSIFRVIFNTVNSKESSIILSEEPLGNNQSRLWYQKGSALGQGDGRTIKKLKDAIDALVLNSDIKNRVEQYSELHKQLLTDERIDELSNDIEYLYEYIDGGQVLGAYDACVLCRPPNISP
jgi:hypothetical protein